MVNRIGTIALALPALALAVLLLAPEVDAFLSDGWAGVGGYGVEAVTFPLSHTTTTPPKPGAPVITDFTPRSGAPGSVVSMSGVNLGGVTAVTFGGVPAASFDFIAGLGFGRAVVPLNALTGPISVTNGLETGITHDNFDVLPIIPGGRGLTVTYTGTEPVRLT